MEWQPNLSDVGLSLTVSGPQGFYLQQRFSPGESPTFSVFDSAGNLRPAGTYVWELRAELQLDEGARQELQSLREPGDEGALRKSGALPAGPTYQSGSFSILDGQIVAGDLKESTPDTSGEGGNRLSRKVVLTNGDGVIRNSLCVGFDCPDSPVFSDSTILLMENNTRIKFGDTSNSPFPNNDWEIEANSSLSGGANYLGFNDCGTADNDGGCATDLVFAVEAGARQNALYVENDGDVGFGTSNPVVNLHVVDGNTPTLRLDQDGSSGFAPQVWDVAGNETNFFVRDVTGGSLLPFRIQPGAPSSSIYIASDGDVGLGTASPSAALDVRRSNAATTSFVVENTNATAQVVTMTLDNTASSLGSWEFRVAANGNLLINDTDATGQVMRFVAATGEVAVPGDLTVDGDLTLGGTCTGCDLVFQPEYNLESIDEHADLMWQNRYLPGVGPTPEGQTSINVFKKTTGILQELEKAHIYIEQLHKTIEDLKAEVGEKDQALEGLQARLTRVEAALGVADQ